MGLHKERSLMIFIFYFSVILTTQFCLILLSLFLVLILFITKLQTKFYRHGKPFVNFESCYYLNFGPFIL